MYLYRYICPAHPLPTRGGCVLMKKKGKEAERGRRVNIPMCKRPRKGTHENEGLLVDTARSQRCLWELYIDRIEHPSRSPTKYRTNLRSDADLFAQTRCTITATPPASHDDHSILPLRPTPSCVLWLYSKHPSANQMFFLSASSLCASSHEKNIARAYSQPFRSLGVAVH